MRRQFAKSVYNLTKADPRIYTLLCDIGVYGFQEVFKDFPDSVCNAGIIEAATVGIAAGMSIDGRIPFVHTIAPFLVERAYEQLKIDFGYQGLRGNFVSVGGSYDYSALGCTHHCPADVALLKQIPNFKIFVPGSPEELDSLLVRNYESISPNYYRLSEDSHGQGSVSEHGDPIIVRKGCSDRVVIAVGPYLNRVMSAIGNLDVSLIYYNTVHPFDLSPLFDLTPSHIFIAEPFYEGTLASDISRYQLTSSARAYFAGVPRKFLTNYGTRCDHDHALSLDVDGLRLRMEHFFGSY